MKNLDEFKKVLLDTVDNGIDDDTVGDFYTTVHDSAKIIDRINRFVRKHGNIALSYGGEWLYQDDEGQVDALELVSDILEILSDYAEDDVEDD